MQVALTEEQQLLVETVRDMVDRAGRPSPRAGEAVAYDDGLWQALVESGLVGMRPVDGASAVEVALVVEQLAAGPVHAPYAGTVLGLELLSLVGAGDAVTSLAGAGRPAAPVVDPELAALAATGLAWDGRPGGAAVALDGESVLLGDAGDATDAVDLTRDVCRVATSGARVGELDAMARTKWEAFALAVLSADLVGAMHVTLLEAVEHTKSREQFGRAVGSFQAVQHLAADALVLVESSRSAMWHAAWAVDALEPAAALDAARVAKAYCAESAQNVCETAIQLWGGIGMTWECRAHLFLRRALLSRRTLGDESVQLAALAQSRLGVGAEVAGSAEVAV